jgi:Family of unknown function (DUF6069)
MRNKAELSFRPARAIPLAMIAAAVAVGAVNYVISIVGIALGAPASQLQLMPPVFLGVSVVVCVLGAVGWQLVARAARKPQRLLRWLVPVAFVVSFVPDLILTLLAHPQVSAILTLAVMHVFTISIATVLFSLILPVRPRVAPAVAAA